MLSCWRPSGTPCRTQNNADTKAGDSWPRPGLPTRCSTKPTWRVSVSYLTTRTIALRCSFELVHASARDTTRSQPRWCGWWQGPHLRKPIGTTRQRATQGPVRSAVAFAKIPRKVQSARLPRYQAHPAGAAPGRGRGEQKWLRPPDAVGMPRHGAPATGLGGDRQPHTGNDAKRRRTGSRSEAGPTILGGDATEREGDDPRRPPATSRGRGRRGWLRKEGSTPPSATWGRLSGDASMRPLREAGEYRTATTWSRSSRACFNEALREAGEYDGNVLLTPNVIALQ